MEKIMWKKRITMFLKMKKCEEVITDIAENIIRTEKKANTDKSGWENQDLKAINI